MHLDYAYSLWTTYLAGFRDGRVQQSGRITWMAPE